MASDDGSVGSRADQVNVARDGATQNITQFGDVYVREPAYRIEVYSFTPLLDADRLREQPSRLLDARSQIVAFSGREQELSRLTGWRDAGGAGLSVLLLHGPGGQGKTRLATRFAELSTDAGWVVVQARRVGAPAAKAPAVGAHTRGVLVIVDYADRWAHTELVQLFGDPLLRMGIPARVLLVGRTVQWWPAMRGELDEMGAVAGDLRLGALAASSTAREEVFASARDRFGAVLGVGVPTTAGPPGPLSGDAFDLVLSLHMAALVTVLAARPSNGDDRTPQLPTTTQGMAAYLLDREYLSWRHMYGKRVHGEEFQTPPTVMARTVFTAVLTGPVSYSAGVRTLNRVDLEPPDRILIDHRACYPPADRATVLEPLYPDRLAEDFVALRLPGHDISAYDPDPWAADVPAALLGSSQNHGGRVPDAGRTLTILAVAAARWAHVGAYLNTVLRADPHAAMRAGSAALVALSECRHVDTAVLESIEALFPPERHVDLDVGIAAVTERLVKDLVGPATAPADVARWKAALSRRLANVGRKAEALKAAQEAIAVLHLLAERDPTEYQADLAVYVMNVGAWLSDLGRREQALDFTERAVAILRPLARHNPDRHEPELAMALGNYGHQLEDLGRRTEAVDACQQSVEIYRRVAARDPAHASGLAFSLTNLGIQLTRLGRHQEALALVEEGVAVYRALALVNPDEHDPGLAIALTNLGVVLFELDRAGEALGITEESVAIGRRLTATNPAAHRRNLARSLINLGGRLVEVGRETHALAAAVEAVDLCRELAHVDPVANEPDLAAALVNLGATAAKAGRKDQAVAVLEEAVMIYGRLGSVNHQAHERPLAAALANLQALEPATPRRFAHATRSAESDMLFNRGVQLGRSGHHAEAEECYRRAADAGHVYAMYNLGHLLLEQNRLAEAESWWRRTADAGLPLVLHNLGVLLQRQGRTDEARQWYQRGAEAGAANAMVNLAALLADQGDQDAAAAWYRQASAAGDPDGDYNLGVLFDKQARTDEAEACYRRAAEAGHLNAIYNLGVLGHRNDRHEEAEKWWRLAAACGHDDARHNLAVLLGERRNSTPDGAIDLGVAMADVRIRQLLDAGELSEAVAVYRAEAERYRRQLELSEQGVAPIRASKARVLRLHRALALSNMGLLESDLGQTHRSLAHTAEAIRLYRHLAACDANMRAVLAMGLRAYAAVRVAANTELPDACRAIVEAVSILGPLAQEKPDAFRSQLSQALLVSADVLDLTGHPEKAADLRDEARRMC